MIVSSTSTSKVSIHLSLRSQTSGKKRQQWMKRPRGSWTSRTSAWQMIRGKSWTRRWRSSSCVRDGFLIHRWRLILESLRFLLTVMETQGQHREELYTVNIWRLIISILTQEATDLNSPKSMEEHCSVEPYKLEVLDQERLRNIQKRWSEDQSHQEFHHQKRSRTRKSLSQIRRSNPKNSKKLTLENWQLCLPDSPRKILKLKRKKLKKNSFWAVKTWCRNHHKRPHSPTLRSQVAINQLHRILFKTTLIEMVPLGKWLERPQTREDLWIGRISHNNRTVKFILQPKQVQSKFLSNYHYYFRHQNQTPFCDVHGGQESTAMEFLHMLDPKNYKFLPPQFTNQIRPAGRINFKSENLSSLL